MPIVPVSDVTELMIWDDCPFRDKVPTWIEIRRGAIPGRDDALVLLARSGDALFHCDVDYDEAHWVGVDGIGERLLGPMVNNLGGMIFDKEHPGDWFRLIRAQALQQISPDDLPLFARLNELSYRPRVDA